MSARDVAVIWDFDGTLVDSHPRNLSVNRPIVEALTGRPADTFPALGSIRAYERAVSRAWNWRDFYSREFDLAPAAVERAGQMWPALQAEDPTPHLPFAGIPEALEQLDDVPHAILSHNDSAVISTALIKTGLSGYFRTILGHEELGPEHQKPAAGGLLRCIRELGLANSARVFFVGDHETDALCVSNARAELAGRESELHVYSVGAFFGGMGSDLWNREPDHSAETPADVVEIVRAYAECERGDEP